MKNERTVRYEEGLSDIFVAISLQAVDKFGVKQEITHLDSSSFNVDGQYETEEEEAGVVKVTYGYSRDHRPDLKQFVMNLISLGSVTLLVASSVLENSRYRV